MFKINWCKIFGHKTYSTERLKKRHNGTRKRQIIIISTTKCMRCGKNPPYECCDKEVDYYYEEFDYSDNNFQTIFD